jgi:hypothetical protein
VVASVTGAVGSVTGAVGSVTGNVGGNVTGSVGSVAAGGITASSIATDAIDSDAIAASAVTEIQSGLATAASLSSVDGKIDTIDGIVYTILVDTNELQTDLTDGGRIDLLIDAIKAKTDNLPSDPADASVLAALIDALPTANENADALLDRTSGVETGMTVRQAMRVITAALAGKASGLDLNMPVFRDVNDTANRIVAVTDENGNRTSVTLNTT